MEFLHLNATYGRLEQQELHLHPGLNLICAPNESGKSTWSAFIRTMLYGCTASAFWPIKALRSKTSRGTPSSCSPAFSAVSPSTGVAVPV